MSRGGGPSECIVLSSQLLFSPHGWHHTQAEEAPSSLAWCSILYTSFTPCFVMRTIYCRFYHYLFLHLSPLVDVRSRTRKGRSDLSLHSHCLDPRPGEGNGAPLQCSCLENPMDGGAWWASVHGVTKNWTRLSDFTFTFHFHALEKEMATRSSVLA